MTCCRNPSEVPFGPFARRHCIDCPSHRREEWHPFGRLRPSQEAEDIVTQCKDYYPQSSLPSTEWP